MADICFDVMSESESGPACEQSSRAARRQRIEIRTFKLVADLPPQPDDGTATVIDEKSPMIPGEIPVPARECTDISDVENHPTDVEIGRSEDRKISAPNQQLIPAPVPILSSLLPSSHADNFPRFGVASVCGRRREMEDSLAVHPNLCGREDGQLHYFGVYDGHGCSHVAVRCSERLHELVREELESRDEQQLVTEWRSAMERSFDRMDKEVTAWNMEAAAAAAAGGAKCRCELRSPDRDAVGSTAVVAIMTPDKIVIANCGDSRAVLSRDGKALPLSSDHKPDRPDELNRIQEAGGRVIYWDGPRVLGVLAMSRAIGDNYLKPYVSCQPEVTVVDRTPEDQCLILGTDGLWDVVSNETACGVGRMCLRGEAPATPDLEAATVGLVRAPVVGECGGGGGKKVDKACSDASLLLTKLALARRSTDNVSVVVVDLRKRDT